MGIIVGIIVGQSVWARGTTQDERHTPGRLGGLAALRASATRAHETTPVVGPDPGEMMQLSYTNHTQIVQKSYKKHTKIVHKSYKIIHKSYNNHTKILQKSYKKHTKIVQQSYTNHTKVVHKSYKIIQNSYKNHTIIIQKSYKHHTVHTKIYNKHAVMSRPPGAGMAVHG